MKCRLLLIADQSDGAFIKLLIERIDDPICSIEVCNTFERGRKRVAEEVHEAIMVTHQIEGQNGNSLDFLKAIRAAGSDAPVIIIAEHPSVDLDDDAQQAGAVDYIAKDQLSPKSLGLSLTMAMRLADKVRRVKPRSGSRKRPPTESTSKTYMANYALGVVAKSAEQNAEAAGAMRELTGQFQAFMEDQGERDAAFNTTHAEIKTGLHQINNTMSQVGGALDKLAETAAEKWLRLIRENSRTFMVLVGVAVLASVILAFVLIAAPAENLRSVKGGGTEEVRPPPPPPLPRPPG
jgi:DNA-binding NarL/FixJ family response regulator